jgi:uncharacterized tellurite resistance protein B-like protein
MTRWRPAASRRHASWRLPRRPAVVAALVLAGGLSVQSQRAAAQTLPTSEDCRACHLGLSEGRLATPAVSYEGDVHAEAGFGCLACHGSGGADSLDPTAGFLATPSRRAIPEMCGRCHSDAAFMRQFDPGLRVDQVQEYWTSEHGQRLMELDDPDVATCVDCHPAHRIRPPDDPASTVYAANIVATCGGCHADATRMAGHELDTNQVAEYTSSVHGRLLFEDGDLSAPVCNDCHGNHGAAPPGIASVRNVCGQCHSVMADYFDQSAHEEIFNARDLPGCATCHEHHAIQPVSDETLRDRAGDLCTTCHVPPDTLGLQFDRMAAVLDSLTTASEESRRALEEVESLGMEVSQALFDLEEVNNVQTRAHSAIHTFRVSDVRDEVAAGLEIANQARERSNEARGEHRFRRVGLGLFSFIVVLMIVGLLLKIEETEERVEGLLDQVETFYEQTLASGYRGRATPEQIRLASSALMLEVCHADGALNPAERSYLSELAQKRFGLDAQEAARLIALGERERGIAGQLDRIAAMLANELSVERKWVLMDELWALACVDGEATPAEVEFMERLTYLLGIGLADAEASRARGAAAVGSTEDPMEES